jgi:hypothetical protein
MLEYHSSFETPEGDQLLWRYLDVGRYLALLSSSALHFSRIDCFDDKWEGEYPEPSKARMRQMEAKLGVSGLLPGANRWMKHTIFANCWHEADYESAAMWRLYGEEGFNLAIVSSVDKINQALQAEERHKVYCGRVKYVDYKKDFVSVGNALTPFLRKRKSFGFEAEVRLLIWDVPIPKKIPEKGKKAKTDTLPTGKHNIAGLDAKVKLSALLRKVLVSPKAPDWYVNVIREVTVKYGLPEHLVARSTFDEGPLR